MGLSPEYFNEDFRTLGFLFESLCMRDLRAYSSAADEEVQARAGMEVDMGRMIAENGRVVTDEMIAGWEDALERDEWPAGWTNVGEIVEGGLPASLSDAVTLSVKVPASMKRAVEAEARSEGKTTSAYVRGVLADSLMTA